jgi:hypothetical protein
MLHLNSIYRLPPAITDCPGYHLCRCCVPGSLSREIKKVKKAGASKEEPIPIVSDCETEHSGWPNSEWTSECEHVAARYDHPVVARKLNATGESLLHSLQCTTFIDFFSKNLLSQLLARALWTASMGLLSVSDLRQTGSSASMGSQTLSSLAYASFLSRCAAATGKLLYEHESGVLR